MIASEKAADDQRKSDRVDGQEAMDDRVTWSGAFCGVGVGEHVAERVQRVQRPGGYRPAKQEKAGDEGCGFCGKLVDLREQRQDE